MSQQKSKAAIKALHAYGKENGERITPPREHVLSIIAAAKQPLTAYDVLDLLGKKLDKPKPPTAYRALEFLMQHGFIHRIESLNAYVACCEDHKHRGSQFMICDDCGHVEEVHMCHVPDGLQKQANGKGFTLSHWNAELHGKCGDCG
jgi:Fur family zinc uptake transcriptional regulator